MHHLELIFTALVAMHSVIMSLTKDTKDVKPKDVKPKKSIVESSLLLHMKSLKAQSSFKRSNISHRDLSYEVANLYDFHKKT